MTDKLKKFVEDRLADAEIYANTYQEVYNYRAIAYGAVMFAEENGLVNWDDIHKWWDNYIWIEFKQLIKEKILEQREVLFNDGNN